ncbi:RNA polymerase, sigma-24 subunit, ECF subfamily protein [Minicystis rosea]|nr:RNA polymerase, sigma-24 subunit, ECF subfamily protein [Minicystis rosea]
MSDERDAFEATIRAHCAAARWSEATTDTIERYGDEVLGYLVAMTRSEVDAGDAFSLACEELWQSLPRFRWESSLRSFIYTIARQALGHVRRDPYRRRAVGISDAGISDVAAQVRSRTATFLRTETRDAITALRAELDPDDQTLLILRVSRGLPWREIARVLAGDEEVSDAALNRSSAALRKRFERLKSELRERARERLS